MQKKLEAYKTMVSEDESYTEEDAVKEKYTAVLADMKKAFTDSTTVQLQRIRSMSARKRMRKKVSTYKDNLTKALGTIKADAVCTEEEITAYEASVNAAVKTYDRGDQQSRRLRLRRRLRKKPRQKKKKVKGCSCKETAKSSDGSASGKEYFCIRQQLIGQQLIRQQCIKLIGKQFQRQ